MSGKIDELLDKWRKEAPYIYVEDAEVKSDLQAVINAAIAEALAVRDEQIERLAKALSQWASGGNYSSRIQDGRLREAYEDADEINRHFGFDIAGVKALKKMIETALRNEE